MTELFNTPFSWSNSMGEFTLLNGRGGDNVIKTIFRQTGETTLFDLGDLRNMTYGELLEVRQALISHGHFDHVFGFDALLRATFPLQRPILFAGPVGLAQQLAWRMKGYTWNLANPGQVDHVVREIHRDGSVTSWHTTNNEFEPKPVENPEVWTDALNPAPFEAPAAFVGRIKGDLSLWALCLDHAGTDSVAYCAVSDAKIKFKVDLLPQLGLRPGPWVGQFQKAYLAGELDREFQIGSVTKKTAELADILLEVKPGERFCYLTDFGATPENLERVRPFIAGADYLGIETNFRADQEEQAASDGHLTTKQAARIIVECGVKSYQTFHYSNAYQTNPDEIEAETRMFVETFK